MTKKARARKSDPLALDAQLCFPLYAASRLVTRLYQSLLEPLGLTYPQYIVLLVLWEDAPCTVTRIGKRTYLNSNTLTPLLKRLEQLGLVVRQRSGEDERQVEISLTKEGRQLRQRCERIPAALLHNEALLEKQAFPMAKARALKDLLDDLVSRLGKGALEQGA